MEQWDEATFKQITDSFRIRSFFRLVMRGTGEEMATSKGGIHILLRRRKSKKCCFSERGFGKE